MRSVVRPHVRWYGALARWRTAASNRLTRPGGNGTPTTPRRWTRCGRTTGRCFASSAPTACDAPRHLAVIPELELDAEVALPEQRNGVLQVITRRRGHADLIALD